MSKFPAAHIETRHQMHHDYPFFYLTSFLVEFWLKNPHNPQNTFITHPVLQKLDQPLRLYLSSFVIEYLISSGQVCREMDLIGVFIFDHEALELVSTEPTIHSLILNSVTIGVFTPLGR